MLVDWKKIKNNFENLNKQFYEIQHKQVPND